MIKVANEKSLTPIVYTFQKNPALLFGRSVEIITPNEERQLILKIWVSVKLLRMIS